MATFKQDNIQFTADNSTLKTAGKKLTKFGNVMNDDFSEEVLSAIGGVQPFVNAVEIDWNGAQLGNNYQSKLVKLVVRLIVRTNSIS